MTASVKTLTISTSAGRKIATLIWRDGTTIVECASDAGIDVARWVRDGIDDWISACGGEGVESYVGALAQHTPAHAPMFLARLGAHLQSRFGFQTMLEDG